MSTGLRFENSEILVRTTKLIQEKNITKNPVFSPLQV